MRGERKADAERRLVTPLEEPATGVAPTVEVAPTNDEPAPPDERTALLALFARVLRLESHTLARLPELTWQQLYGELQWWGDTPRPTLAAEDARRRSDGARPWCHHVTPLDRSDTLLRVLEGHEGVVTCCAIAPDGSYLVSAGDTTIRLWDPLSGQVLRTFDGAEGVNACAVGPDGSWIVSASEDGTLTTWRAADGRRLRTLKRHEGPVVACAISADGSFVLSASEDTTLRTWNPATGRVRHILRGHDGAVWSCAISPDTSFAVSTGEDPTLRIWDPRTGKELRKLEGDEPMLACAVSPDCSYVVASAFTTEWDHWLVHLADPHKAEWLECFMSVEASEDHTDMVSALAVSPDQSFIVSASVDLTLTLWNPKTLGQLERLEGHADSVEACAVSPDAEYVVSTGADKTVRMWASDPRFGAGPPGLVGRLRGGRSSRQRLPIRACAVGADGSLLVSASYEELAVLEPDTAAHLRRLDAPRGADDLSQGRSPDVTACAVSPDGKFVVAASNHPYPNALRIWSVEDEQELTEPLQGHEARITSCAVAPDGSFVVSASEDTTLRLWAAADGRQLRTLRGHEGPVLGCAVSPDGSVVASAGADGTVRTWNRPTGRARRTVHGHGAPVTCCAFSTAGASIVSAGEDGTVKLWGRRGQRARRTFVGHTGGVASCAVSPDGSLVVSGGRDGTVRVWDVETAREVAKACFPGAINSVALYPDRPRVACGDSMGNVNLVDVVDVGYGWAVTGGR